jgi:exopolyphosphatase/guanosine-5'-triphosphate,3'-diphosphate pyrophosphatase
MRKRRQANGTLVLPRNMPQRQILLSPEWRPRLAVIDIGTNSIRLTIAEATSPREYRVLDDEKETVRLGRGMTRTGRLDPVAVERALGAVRRMKQIAAGFEVTQLKAIATCAVREAKDGEDFCRRMQEEVGLEVEVISDRREAELAFFSVARSFDLEGKNVAVVDIGGGSAEIILSRGNIVEESYSLPLGAVRVTERFKIGDTLGTKAFDSLLRRLGRRVRKLVGKPLLVPHVLIGSGGTFSALGSMVLAQRGKAHLPLQGCQVSRAELSTLLNRLRKMSLKARCGVPGLSPDRADIILGGLAVIDRIMRHLKVNNLQVHTGGIRQGLLLSQLGALVEDSPADRGQAIERFAARCGVDVRHDRHVAALAASLYDQLAPLYGLPPSDRELLEVSAQLQDVGYLVDYDDHHKHSYHLILNSHLPGFDSRDLEVVANVARYHRGALPKRKHENYRRLSSEDRRRVRVMAAILRLAGGLDRSHTQQVRGVSLCQARGGLHLHVQAEQYPEVDVWGARRRAVLFEREFKTPLEIEWQPDGEPTS